ncbi:MAG: stage II sporulation protein P, partial [Acutalibacteraceae bacterium]
SIAVVIDLHRDSITYDSGTKVRPVTVINGKTAAQIMICTGSNTGRVSGYDNWESNFRFAIRLQQSCEKNYKNLARPLYFVSKKYNHDLCSGSLLIEVGSEANTLEEAKYAARLTAKAMAKVLAPLSE